MAQTGALQLRCCANKNSVTHNSFSLQIVKRSLFTHANPLWPQGQHDRPCPWAILSPGRERENELKLKVLLLFAFDANDRRKKRLQMELFVTLCAPPCSSSVYWQPVITVLTTIGASKCSHLTVIVGNRLQVLTGAVAFLFFLSSPRKATVLLLPYVCAVPRHTFVLSNRSVNKIGTTIYARSLLEFLFLNRV